MNLQRTIVQPPTLTLRERCHLAGELPFKRCLHAGTVLASNRLLMYGGCGSGGFGPCPSNQAWTLDQATSPVTSQWSLSPASCAGPRIYSNLVPLPGSTTTAVLFGGSGSIFGSGDAGAVSVWDASIDAWKYIIPAGATYPSVRRGAGLAYYANGTAPSATGN